MNSNAIKRNDQTFLWNSHRELKCLPWFCVTPRQSRSWLRFALLGLRTCVVLWRGKSGRRLHDYWSTEIELSEAIKRDNIHCSSHFAYEWMERMKWKCNSFCWQLVKSNKINLKAIEIMVCSQCRKKTCKLHRSRSWLYDELHWPSPIRFDSIQLNGKSMLEMTVDVFG